MASQGLPFWLVAQPQFEGAEIEGVLRLRDPAIRPGVAVVKVTITGPDTQQRVHTVEVKFAAGSNTAQFSVPAFEDNLRQDAKVEMELLRVDDGGLGSQRPDTTMTWISNNDFNLADIAHEGGQSAWKAISRTSTAPTTLAGELATAKTVGEAIHTIATHVQATTSVVVTAHQFFNGRSPALEVIDHNVNSPANADDLNDAQGLYGPMSLENRYINFAVSTAKAGPVAGPSIMQEQYASLTFAQAADKAYETIVGKTAAAEAGIDVTAAIADIVSRQAYFDAIARERAPVADQAMAAKAGLIGYIIAEAMKANVGAYARAVENFYLDLSDGGGHTWVDLVGVYGAGTPLDAIA